MLRTARQGSKKIRLSLTQEVWCVEDMSPKPEEQTHKNSLSSCSLDDESGFPVIEVASEEVMMDLFAEIKRIKLSCPISLKDEKAKKEWIWEHHKKTLMEAMFLSCDEIDNTIETIREQQPQGEKAQEEIAPEGEKQLQGQEEAQEEEESEEELYNKKRFELLDRVAHVQRNFLLSEGPKVVYTCLLNGILELMQGEFGFIGEVKYAEGQPESEDTMYLQTHGTSY
jgi:hypothetical protein